MNLVEDVREEFGVITSPGYSAQQEANRYLEHMGICNGVVVEPPVFELLKASLSRVSPHASFEERDAATLLATIGIYPHTRINLEQVEELRRTIVEFQKEDRASLERRARELTTETQRLQRLVDSHVTNLFLRYAPALLATLLGPLLLGLLTDISTVASGLYLAFAFSIGSGVFLMYEAVHNAGHVLSRTLIFSAAALLLYEVLLLCQIISEHV